MTFQLQHTDHESEARAGIIHTAHGDILTPIFMPVGTVGSVKGVSVRDLKEEVKAQIILGNTYHLYLRPGTEILEKAGGLHRFNSWDGPILTDSGGFQVFSLTGIRKLTEEGCTFRSHIDGSKHIFTPERVMDIERSIGADIMMALDECPPGTSEYAYAKKSLGLTHRWLDRCLKRFHETEPKYGYEQSLFPIVQGCTYRDLRVQSAEFVAEKGCDGNAIGGLAVGEPAEVMYEMIEVVNAILPKDKPRYLMGVGTPANLLEGIERGHVRLCNAHPKRKECNDIHCRGYHQPAQPEVARRFQPTGSSRPLYSGPHIHKGLHAPSLQGTGVTGPGDCIHPQSLLLPLAHWRGTQTHSGGRLPHLEE